MPVRETLSPKSDQDMGREKRRRLKAAKGREGVFLPVLVRRLRINFSRQECTQNDIFVIKRSPLSGGYIFWSDLAVVHHYVQGTAALLVGLVCPSSHARDIRPACHSYAQ